MFNRVVLVALLVNFVDMMGVSIVIPLFPVLIKEFGATNTQLGLLGSAYGAAQFIGSPLMGYLSDVTSRKSMLLLSCLGAAVSYTLIGFATSFYWLLLSRVPVGLLKQSLSVSQAFVADHTTEKDRARAFSFLNSSVAAGFIVGPLVSGKLHHQYGRLTAALTAASMFVLNAVLVTIFLPGGNQSKTKVDTTVKSAPLKGTSTNSASLIALVFLRFVSLLPVQIFRTTVGSHVTNKYGLGSADLGELLSYLGVLGVVNQIVGTHFMTARFSDLWIIRICACILGVAMFGLANSPDYRTFAILMAPMSFSNSVMETVLVSSITRATEKSNTGRVLGASGSCDSISRMVLPIVGGYMMDHYGFSWAIYLSICGTIALFFATLIPSLKRITAKPKAE